jgi:AraC-like DNA-binding protein
MTYSEHKPPQAVERWVECTWSTETSAPVQGFAVRPDGCMDLLYSASGLEMVGAMTRAQAYDLPSGSRAVGLRFRPGMARRFLGVAAEELTDRVLPLHDAWGARAHCLESRLAEAASIEECRVILLDAVAGGCRPLDPVQRAIEAMTQANGEVDIEWAADQATLSPRQFRRRCLEESGLTPKHLARVLRFRRACRLAERGESWLRVAAEAGYFDQAHLIRDFHEFAGVTPMSVFSKTTAGCNR